METAVRYFSKFGNTKAIAEEIAAGLDTEALSIVDEPELPERCGVLFLGGAPYCNVMAPELAAYAERLRPDQVGKVVLFSTSNWSRRTVLALRKKLKAQGIPVVSDHFWAHMTQIERSKPSARAFGASGRLAVATGAPDKQAVVAEAVSSAVIVGAFAVLSALIARRLAR